MHNDAAESQLLSIAESISDRQPVNWDDLSREIPADQAAIVEQLRLVESVARLGEDTPETWGPYTIAGEIGRGAFGTVYRAFDTELHRDVALKVIRPMFPGAPFDPEHALDEARRLARVNHANVVRVYRADRAGDEVGMAMELIAGDTLAALVKQRGPFSADEAALIGMDLCRALAAVHGAGTLHGDIKAHNVMRGAGGRITLTDFGTSKDLSREQRRLGGDFAGTPLYLAPEVFRGEARTLASDIYSLGVLLFYLVSGTYPVDGSTRTEVGRHHDDGGARRLLRDVRPDLPNDFVRVVEQALADDPRARYASAGAFEAALNGVLSHRPATPLFPRKPVLVLAGVLVLAAIVALVAPWRSGIGRGAVGSAAASAGTPAPAADGSYLVDAAVYREVNGVDEKLAPGARLKLGDRLALHLQTSVSAFVYVVNEDEKGDSYLLFPIKGRTDANPLPGGTRHRLPGTRVNERLSWRVTSEGVREHFLIFVSPQPSPMFDRLFAALPPPEPDAPLAVKIPPAAVETLRGVGGLVSTTVHADQGIRHIPDYSTALPPSEETARGLWVRQIAFDNPVLR
jgi:eukaryotic-like serine/threonine-protein kinase